MGNYNSLFAIVSGLEMGVVSRLKMTWKSVPEKYISKYNNRILPIVSVHQNYTRYRSCLAQQQLPAVPYVGIALRDLTWIEEGNLSFCVPNQLPIVNFEKFQMMSSCLSKTLRFQESQFPQQLHSQHLLFESFIVSLDPITCEDLLYSESVTREPPKSNL